MSPPTFPLLSNALSAGSTSLLRLAVESGEVLSEFEAHRKSSIIIDMMKVCAERSLEPPSVAELLDLGASVDTSGWMGLSPLSYVLMRGTGDSQSLITCVISLLCGGAEVNCQVPTEMSGLSWRSYSKNHFSYPLSLAIQSGNLSAVEVILLAGGSPDGPGGEDVLNPLSIAAIWKESAIMKLLLRRGADVHAKNDDGTTPLHHCWDEENAILLVAAGASISISDNDGRLPIHDWVERSSKPSTLDWISGIAAQDRFIPDASGKTAYALLKERLALDDANIDWLAPIASKWEADFISQSTEDAQGEVQGRRL